MDDELAARLDALDQKLDLLGYALAEVAVLAYPELHPLALGHDPARMQAHAANAMKVMRLYGNNSYTDALDKFVEDREAAQAAQRISDAEAEEMNRTFALTHQEPPHPHIQSLQGES